MDAIQQAKTHFISHWPNEAAGYVKNGEFFPLENISTEDKRDKLEVNPGFLMEEPELFLHSHTTNWKRFDVNVDPRSPSERDLQGQIDTDIEWGIIVTDGENASDPYCWGNPKNRPALEGRDFIYNIQDCISLARDWAYETHGVVLPTVARDPFWHQDGKNYIEELFPAWGFYEVPKEDIKAGDWLLYKVRSEVINHVGVYLGDNKVLSHWCGRASATESYGTWARHVLKVIRHEEFHK